MLRYFLDELEVEAPVGLDGLALKRVRHPRYWGFLYRRIGYVEGVSGARFRQAKARQLLRRAFDRESLSAITRFRIVDDLRKVDLYDAYVDYAQYRRDFTDQEGELISITFRDEQAVTSVEVAATTRYAIAPTQRLTLHARTLSGEPLYSIPGPLVQRSTKNASALTHALPFVRKSERDQSIPGEMRDITDPFYSQPSLYRNTGDGNQALRLTALVSAIAQASAQVTATIQVRVGNNPGDATTIPVATVSVNTNPTTLMTAIDLYLLIGSGQNVWVEISGPSVTSFSFTYSSDTYLSLSVPSAVADSSCMAETVHELLLQAVARQSGGRISLVSDFFRSGEGQGVLLTNGAQLRGLSSPVLVSLQDLFDGLNPLFNLMLFWEMGESGPTLRLESKEYLRTRSKTRISNLTSFSETPALELIFSSVTAGYATWRGDSSLSGEEPNSLRQYSTRVTTSRQGLDLTSPLIASGTLIEEQRRKQFSTETASSTKADQYDNALFVICSTKRQDGWHNERLESVADISGLTNPGSAYNVRITPRRNLQRWANLLAPSLPITYQTSQAGDKFQCTLGGLFLAESDSLRSVASPLLGTTSSAGHASPGAVVARKVILTAPLSMDAYASLGDWITYDDHEGRRREGLLVEADWRETSEGSEVTLTIYE